jgi:hypothetical protein
MPVLPPRFPDSAPRRAPARSRTALARSAYVVVVVGALLTLSAWAIASARPGSQPGTNAAGNTALGDDDADTALFQLAGLAPGQTASRCIAVSNDGAVPDGIRLIGSAVGSGLYEYLHLTVDAGSGGSFSDCAGFTGAPVFDGSLGDFVRGHHDYDSGLVASTPVQAGSTTFRLQVSLDDVAAAQGGTATASFAWEARTADIVVAPISPAPEPVVNSTPTDPQPAAPGADARPAPAPARDAPKPDAVDRPTPDTPNAPAPQPGPASPTAPDRAAPLPVPGSTPSEAAQPRPAASPPRKRAAKPAASPTVPQAPGAPRRSAPAVAGTASGDADRGLVKTIAAVAAAIAPVVQRTAFPLILLLLGGLFLLIQNRIDSRDPKLANAPLHAQPDLPFLSPHSPGDAVS